MTIAPEGRRLLRVEARNAETPIERKPEWIRTTAKMGPEYTKLHSMVKTEGLHTVCQEAGCPNIFECWEDREATFLIGGDVCTRRCDFCDIATGRPEALDRDEPRRVAESVAQMGLRYSTVTGRRPRRPARRRRLALRRDDPPDPRQEPQHRRRDPAARLRRQARARRPGLRRPARGVRAQPRDRAAHLQADPARLHLRQVAPGAVDGPRGRAGHQVQPHPRHGRGGPRGRAGDPRPARRRLRHPHHHPVPPALQAAPPDRPVGQARGVRALERRRRRRWASRASWPGRWCARPTAPDACGRPRCSKWGRDIPEHLQHLAEAAGDPARQEASSLLAARQPGVLGAPA